MDSGSGSGSIPRGIFTVGTNLSSKSVWDLNLYRR